MRIAERARRKPREYWLAIMFAALMVVPSLNAQIVVYPLDPPALPAGVRARNLPINGAISSVTGFAWATIRHTPRWRGIARGTAGGILASAGKQTASSRFSGSG